jgi:hypothetical protein
MISVGRAIFDWKVYLRRSGWSHVVCEVSSVACSAAYGFQSAPNRVFNSFDKELVHAGRHLNNKLMVL